jgi:ABC-type transport system involved in multi-copper enzyme maturation permease subunit
MTQFKAINGIEKARGIAIGLMVSLIFAAMFSIFAPWIFSWIANLFNPTSETLRDCQLSDYLDKTISEYRDCWNQSESYEAKVRRLKTQIPWFWMALIFFGWIFLKNPLKGQIRDDSNDIIYPLEGLWELILHILIQIFLIVSIWAFLARDKSAFTGLATVIVTIVIWCFMDKFFRKKYGKLRSEHVRMKSKS